MRTLMLMTTGLLTAIGQCGMPGEDVGGSVLVPSSENQGGVSSGTGPHLESGGRVIVEAEHYASVKTDAIEVLGQEVELNNRMWYLQAGAQSGPGPDPDGYHAGASGDAYMECLPDTRVTHGDGFAPGSFYDDGNGASLEYEIQFETPGTYYVWARAYSTGTEDNGIHVSVNGVIPPAGEKIQWCGKEQWQWSNAQRDSGGSSCGVNGTIMIEIPSAGLHTIGFHQREDGFEFDRFMLTTDGNYEPEGAGPVESPRLNPE